MIEVRNLTRVFGDTTAVDGISFDVPAGEILGFLGPNGAGKSTTMRILTGYTPPTSGTARIAGLDVVRRSRDVRRMLGYLPENAPVYGDMTVRGFLAFFAETKGLRGTSKRAAVDLALEECGLTDVDGRLLRNLSKGYRQRAGIAQAVVGDPKVLILDEPTVGLDPNQVRGVRSLIRKMAGRRTVVLSTHILPEVSLTCSRVVIIDRGRVVAVGTPEHIESNLRESNRLIAVVRGPYERIERMLRDVERVKTVHSRTHGAPSAEDAAEAVETNEYEIAVDRRFDARAEIARAVVENGFELLELRSVGLSLEDVFIHTITRGAEARSAAERAEEAAS